VLQPTVQVLLTHAGWPFGSVVLQTCAPPSGLPHPPQLSAVLDGSTHLPLQIVGADGGHDVHARLPPSTAPQTMPASESHTSPQPVQLSDVPNGTHAKLQSEPASHA
jgi:hypothetical protein